MKTPFQQDDLIILFISIYCFVDDFHQQVLAILQPALQRPDQHHPPTKRKNLTATEAVSLAIFFQFTTHTNWKSFYRYITTHFKQDFPKLPTYGNFIRTMNDLAPYAVLLTQVFCAVFNKHTPTSAVKFADSTPVPVCHIKRSFSHKVMKGIATRSKSTMGWFYGFKLHIVVNELMQILNCRITTANTDDRAGLMMMWNHIFGLIVADAGYLGKDFNNAALNLGKRILAAVRANMKKLMTKTGHALLKARGRVETVFSVLKDRMGLVSSLPRSPQGHFARYAWCLAAYQLKQYWQAFLLPSGMYLA